MNSIRLRRLYCEFLYLSTRKESGGIRREAALDEKKGKDLLWIERRMEYRIIGIRMRKIIELPEYEFNEKLE